MGLTCEHRGVCAVTADDRAELAFRAQPRREGDGLLPGGLNSCATFPGFQSVVWKVIAFPVAIAR